jgi:transaldolase
VPLNETAKNLGIEKFWEVPQSVIELGRSLDRYMPATGEDMVVRVHTAGLGDMFPGMSIADNERISAEGKIPVLSSWRDRIISGELAPDTLLTLAGIASFTADQRQLDERIRGIIG